jgi:peptidoglycan/LPS O-acetylase OafA/YrhL
MDRSSHQIVGGGKEPSRAQRSLGYFPAVDGLRAVAVGTVMLFHLKPGMLPGGFVGVDIFFVISGFVVTASLAHLEFPGIVSLLSYFYARRLTRIMPALAVCLLVTVAIYVLLIPSSWLSHLTENTGISAFIGASNIVLARNSDTYFATTSAFNPFLHTWSLGVEEQFYLVFPFLLLFHARRRQTVKQERMALASIVLLGIASFGLCGFFAFTNPKLSFYMLPARFWELAMGMVLALTFDRWKWRIARLSPFVIHGIATAAIGLLIVSLATLSENRFPFPMAILPAVGAALVIMLSCALPGYWSTRCLAVGPVLWVGLRSYSLYLWHWPVYVLMRWTVGLETVGLQLVAVGLTLLAGHLSYILVEQPLRSSARIKAIPRGRVALAGLAAALLATGAGATLFKAQHHISISQTSRYRADWYTDGSTRLLPAAAGCSITQTGRPIGNGSVTVWARQGCASPAEAGRLFVIGNSHALAYRPMLRQFVLDSGHEARLYFRSECAFLQLNAPMTAQKGCSPFYDQAQAEFLSQLHPGDILFMPSMRLDQGEDQWGAGTSSFTDPASSAAAMVEAKAVLETLAKATGALLIFEAPKPMIPAPTYRCVDWYMAENPICKAGLSIDKAAMLALRAPVLEKMQALAAENANVRIWDPLPTLCPGSTCQAMDGRLPIFFDRHHVSTHGNQMLRAAFDGDFTRWFGDGAGSQVP